MTKMPRTAAKAKGNVQCVQILRMFAANAVYASPAKNLIHNQRGPVCVSASACLFIIPLNSVPASPSRQGPIAGLLPLHAPLRSGPCPGTATGGTKTVGQSRVIKRIGVVLRNQEEQVCRVDLLGDRLGRAIAHTADHDSGMHR